MNKLYACILTVVLFALSACGFDTQGNSDSDTDNGTTRSFYMGFTDQPYEDTSDAINDNYGRINDSADIVLHQFRDGIPWDEAFNSASLPQGLQADINDRVSQTANQKIVLSVDVINAGQTGIIGTWSENGVTASQAPWSDRGFSSAEVIDAYSNYANELIDQFNADYFIYGEEVSELIVNSPEQYDDFVIFAQEVYDNIKEQNPDVDVLFSLALRSPNDSNTLPVLNAATRIIDATDILGLSVYPFRNFEHPNRGNPDNLPDDWISQARILAGDKPLAITQTGWVAEDLTLDSDNFFVSGSPATQDEYVTALLAEANQFNLAFVIWYTCVDYDTFWQDTLNEDENERLRRDTGLYDQELSARDSLTTWNDFFTRTLEP